MGLKHNVLVLIIASSILLSGCTFPLENSEEEKTENDINESEIDLFPQLFVSDTQVEYNEYASINGSVVDEQPSKVTIYITLMPSEGSTEDLEALMPFNVKSDGTWTRALPIYEPGTWIIGVSATDINQQSTDIEYLTLEMLKPNEGLPTINTDSFGPYQKDEIGYIYGTIEHMFPETCIVRLLLENGYEEVVETEGNGDFQIELEILTDNTTAILEAYCGKWSDSSTVLEVPLILIGADDQDGDGINDEYDSCPQGSTDWNSNTALDYDLDGCRDIDEDDDDDEDGIIDSLDFCSKGVMGWTSNLENDYDYDGCRDIDEDNDDDADGIMDIFDSCPRGEKNWNSNMYDWDSDGCKDDTEDIDDDDDTVHDNIDSCMKGKIGWVSNSETDWDGDGCRDSDEDTDIDADGVINGDDKCPWTTDYTSVDTDGCDDYQRDSDEDGIRDLDDDCEDTPAGLVVLPNGCGDRDGDGITFDQDLCPNTPNDLKDEVNEVGCSDTDFDGITEDIDLCPNSPTERWTIDQNGCSINQVPVTWNAGPYGTNPMDHVKNFNFDTLSGTNWGFQNEWTGQDNYLFFGKYAASSYNVGLWNQNVGDLIDKLPDEGTHFFFASFDTTFHSDVYAKRTDVNSYLSTLIAEEEAYWMDHIHYIDERFFLMNGGLGEVIDDWSAFYYGIDNFQRWREVGSIYDYNSNNYNLDYLAHESQMYSNEFNVEIRQQDSALTSVIIFDQWHNGGWGSGFNSYSNATFPNSTVMSTFNTLELYFYHSCDEHKTRYDSDGDGTSDSGCHEWDYLEYLKICDEVNNHSTCGTEFSRYITTYGREGQWLTDISPFLFMIKDGGTHEFKFSGANKGGLKLVALLSNWNDDGMRPTSGEFLFGGGSFRGDYNNEDIYKRQHNLTIPQGVDKSELVALITGHGFSDDNANCAEFCNSEHRFLMNGYDTQQDYPHAGNSSKSLDQEGCMEQVSNGTVANQLGTWPYARAGWCPGMDVKQWRFDMTTWIGPSGGTNNIQYQGLYNGIDYQPVNDDGGGSQRIEVASWIVYYENNSGGATITSINIDKTTCNYNIEMSNSVLDSKQYQSNFQFHPNSLDILRIERQDLFQ